MADRLTVAAFRAAAAAIACGNGHPAAAPAVPVALDAGTSDAWIPRAALGVRLVDHDAIIQGVTSDGYVIYTNMPGPGPVAHAIRVYRFARRRWPRRSRRARCRRAPVGRRSRR